MHNPLPANAAVWFEIPVSDMKRAQDFYSAVVGNALKEEDGGPNMMVAFPAASEKAVSGHLYPGKPAAKGTGATIHLSVPDLEAALERVTAHGGEVVSPVVTIPPGRFAYCLDPDGNSFGLFT